MKQTPVFRVLFVPSLLALAAASCRAPEARPAPPFSSDSAAVPASAPVEVPAPANEDVAATIDHLLATISNSDLVFVRNGVNYQGRGAADHIRKKHDFYRREIATPEQFIDKVASRSEASGKPYLVRFQNGKQQPLGEWLTARLAEWRAGAPR